MRRVAFLTVVLVAAACTGSVAGARGSATLSKTPSALSAFTVWNATLTIKPAPSARPAVDVQSSNGSVRVFATQRITREKYAVRLTFTTPGRTTLSARIAGKRTKLRVVTVAETAPPAAPFAGAPTHRVCAGAGIPYQQYGLTIGFGSLWVACTKRGEVARVDPATGAVQAWIPVPGEPVFQVSAGERGVWAIALRGNVVYRIDPATNRVAAQVPLQGSVPYLWAGAGAVWAADDGGFGSTGSMLRLNAATARQEARVQVGDGPAGFATDGSRVWILNHRENTLDRIDVATNRAVRLSSGLAPANVAAVERLALRNGTLWATGRGADLLRVSPETGAVLGTTEIGSAGIDVAATADAVWVASYDAAFEQQGIPVVATVARVDPATAAIASSRTPTRRLYLTGLASDGTNVWVYDAVAGLLVRIT
jgi:streptogramin lyase